MNVNVRHKTLAIIGSCAAVVLIVVAAVLVTTHRTTSVPRGSGGPSASPSASPATMTVQVYFHKLDELAAVSRIVPTSADKPSAALSKLLAGPTATERRSGYYSFFSAKTADMLRSVRVVNHVALADFRDFRLIIPNASSSAGSQALLDELDATLRQYGSIRSTVYSFNGDVAAFYEWLQRIPPSTLSPITADKMARDFLRQVAGMRELSSEATRTVATGLVEVDLRSDSGSGPMTTVSLRLAGGSWQPFMAKTPAIWVEEPTLWQVVASPVTVAGHSATFEGQLLVSVLQSADGSVSVLGRDNSILGGSTGIGPFSGQVAFTQPTASQGWLVVTYQSAKTGAIAGATAVPVSFTGHAAIPRIDSVRVTSGQPIKDGWLTLSAGTGRVVIVIRTANADHVQIYLTPTGTNTAPLAKLIGQGAPVHGQCTIVWAYPDQPMLDHLSVVAVGSGGRTEAYPFNVTHP
jgi:hypothetical protein